MSKSKSDNKSKQDLVFEQYLRDKNDLCIDFVNADDLAREFEKAIAFLKSLYENNSSNPENRRISNEIDFIHADHGEMINELFKRFNPSAVRASTQTVFNEGRGLLALDAEYLVKKAIERDDAKSAAFLMFIYSCQILALGEDIYQPYITDYLSEERTSSNARKNRQGKTNKAKDALLEGLQTLSENYGKVPTVKELIEFLKSNEENEYMTGVSSCPEIWYEDEKIKFSFRSNESNELTNSAISPETYRTEYKNKVKFKK